jgi:hypothetical protein
VMNRSDASHDASRRRRTRGVPSIDLKISLCDVPWPS